MLHMLTLVATMACNMFHSVAVNLAGWKEAADGQHRPGELFSASEDV